MPSYTITNPKKALDKITSVPLKKLISQIFFLGGLKLTDTEVDGFYADSEFSMLKKTFNVKISSEFFEKYTLKALRGMKEIKPTLLDEITIDDKKISITIEVIEDKPKPLIKKLVLIKSGKRGVVSGGESQSIGGTVTESLSEGFFCIYLGLRLKVGKTNFRKKCDELVSSVSAKDPEKGLSDFCSKNNITNSVNRQLQDTEFKSKKNLWKGFLVLHGWNEKMISMCEKFVSESKIKEQTKYYLMRTRMLEDTYNPYLLYKTFAEKMKNSLGFAKSLGDDKWNPGDVWIMSQDGIDSIKKTKTSIIQKKKANVSVVDMNLLGKLIQRGYDNQDIFPVSLKAPTKTVHYTLINYIAKNKKDQMTESFRFAGTEKMKSLFTMNNRDVKIPFIHEIKKGNELIERNEGNIKLKAFSSGSYRFEIEYRGAGAKGGSIGTENWQFLISRTDKTGINKMKKIRANAVKTPKNTSGNFIWDEKGNIVDSGGSQDTNWFGGLTYAKLNNSEKLKLVPLLMDLCKEINPSLKVTGTNNATFVLDKTSSAEIAVSVLFMRSESAKNDSVNSMFNLASSRNFSYVSHSASGKRKLETLMNSCFHIKLH